MITLKLTKEEITLLISCLDMAVNESGLLLINEIIKLRKKIIQEIEYPQKKEKYKC